MDPAAVMVADMALQAAQTGRGGDKSPPRILDACAAPGGKTFRLHSQGARVVAVDRSSERLALLQQNAARLGHDVEVQAHDWLDSPHGTLGEFDVVLVDAPCSGLGTVRRHPEIKWRLLPSDPAAMGLRQRPILAAASHHVKSGGALIYAVCSTEPEEGEAIASSLEGWEITQRWNSVPPMGDEDGFQAFELRRQGSTDFATRPT